MPIKDKIRAIFKFSIFERLLVHYSTNKPYGSGLTKLTPNHYSYNSPTIRKVTRNGIHYQLDISNIVDWNIYFGFYEAAREKLFQLVENPVHILDVGANIGEISLRFAQQFPQATIHSFEPFAPTFEVLNRNVRLNKFTNLVLNQLGLGASEQVVLFEERSEGNPGMNRITNDATKSVCEIKTTTLDLYCREHALPTVSLIKMDVEGYEMEVIKGAKTVLEAHKPILFIELDDANLQEQGSSAKELIQFLSGLNYAIHHAETDVKITADTNLQHCHFDVVCKPLTH